MQLILHPFDLPLRHPFTTSIDTHVVQHTLVVELRDGPHSGFGEATSNEYYGVTIESLCAVLNLPAQIESYPLAEPAAFWQAMHGLLGEHPFAQCALDEAAHDLWGKRLAQPVYKLWGLSIDQVPPSDYTIGIDAIDRMVAKLAEFPGWPIYKIKLGTADDVEIVSELRKHTDATFRVDANTGWNAETTIANAKELRGLGVEFIEQPLKADDWDGMRRVFAESVLPVIADESCIVESDVPRCEGYFHGVNIKLTKCGGLTPARRMIERARQLGLQVMVGCMLESTVGISAIAQLLPLLDYVDMDGAVLISRDVASGVRVERGQVVYPAEAGCGVRRLLAVRRQNRVITMYIMQSAPNSEAVINGRPYLYFIGTGYLGLQGHPDVIRAACAALEQYGVHSATTRRAFGNQQIVLDVERQAAEYFGAEDGFYYISGYQGNTTLLSALKAHVDRVLVDDQAHYSVTAAIQLAGLPSTSFRHCDAADLREQLAGHLAVGEKPIVMTDGVFPVSGDIAPLGKYVEVLSAYAGAAIAVDDAHGVGVLGQRGRGSLEYAGLDGPWVNALPTAPLPTTPLPAAAPGVRLYTCGTLSKAFGGSGGIICGGRDFVAALKAGSRYYDAASAPAVPVAGASLAGLQLAAQGELRASLARNVVRFKTGLRRLGFDVADTPVPYVGLVAGDAGNMQRIQRELMERGIAVAYLATYSSVGAEGALRIAMFATHTDAMIDRLLENLAAVL